MGSLTLEEESHQKSGNQGNDHRHDAIKNGLLMGHDRHQGREPDFSNLELLVLFHYRATILDDS